MSGVGGIAPPRKAYRRARGFAVFERLFRPVIRSNGSLLWEPSEVPAGEDGHHWWTVLDYDGKLYLAAGFRFANRFAYVQCAVAWDGNADDHPDYVY